LVGLRSNVEGERETARREEQPADDGRATPGLAASPPSRLWPHDDNWVVALSPPHGHVAHLLRLLATALTCEPYFTYVELRSSV